MAEVKIDVPTLTSQLREMVRSSENLKKSTDCCIFRVPNILRRHNPRAYEPSAFSIGPFHHGKPHLEQSQTIKANYLKALLSRTDPETTDLRDLVNAVSQIQDEARNCYAGPIGMSMNDFIKLLVLDGCFIIELFLRYYDGAPVETPHDPIFDSLCQVELLYHDLILLENQIPWMVLKLLFNMTTNSSYNMSLVELAFSFFTNESCFSPGKNVINLSNEAKHIHLSSEAKHILDLFRCSMVSSFDTTQSGYNQAWKKNMPSASSLKEAGIKFKIVRNPKSILAVKFDPETGVLEIPPLIIHECTEPLFRNLIGFEQCQPGCDSVVTSYAVLLDNLINTNEDVEILCEHEVIRNWLNAEVVTKFFNKLYDDTFVANFYYNKLVDNVNGYCRRRWPKYRTRLMHDYFKHPWSIFSVIAAVLLLFFAFFQTLFTLFSIIK